MRTRLLFTLAISTSIASFAGCDSGSSDAPGSAGPATTGGGSSGGGPTTSVPEGGVAPDAGASNEGGTGPAAKVTVNGSVLDSWTSSGVDGLVLRVLGADGVGQDITTDPTGRFVASNVALPYDLVAFREVTGAPVQAFLGVSHQTPRFYWTINRDYTRSTELRFTVNVPACDADSCDVTVHVTTSDGKRTTAGGHGRGLIACTGTLQFDGAPTRTASVLALVTNQAGTYFATATTNVAVADGASVVVPTLTPQALPIAGTFTIQVEPIGVPPSWGAPRTSAHLQLPGGGVGYLPNAASPLLSVLVPQLAGASVTGGVSYSHPTKNYASTSAGSKAIAPGDVTETVKVYGPPDILRPLDEGSMSMGEAIEWDDGVGVPALFSVGVGDPSNFIHLVTTKRSVSFEKLTALGLNVTPGAEWRIQVGASRPVISVDEFLSPTGSVGSARFSSLATSFNTFALTP